MRCQITLGAAQPVRNVGTYVKFPRIERASMTTGYGGGGYLQRLAKYWHKSARQKFLQSFGRSAPHPVVHSLASPAGHILGNGMLREVCIKSQGFFLKMYSTPGILKHLKLCWKLDTRWQGIALCLTSGCPCHGPAPGHHQLRRPCPHATGRLWCLSPHYVRV